MFDSIKNDKVKIITLIGMAVMLIAVAVKAATSSAIAAAVIHIAGLACFFIIEGIEKTPDSESGLSFKRFFSDLKKPGVLLLILFLLVLSPVEMLLSKAVFGSAYIDHVLGRVNVPGLDQLPLLLFNQIVSVLGEEIEFRAFFVGKGMKRFSFCRWRSSAPCSLPRRIMPPVPRASLRGILAVFLLTRSCLRSCTARRATA